MVVDIQTFGYVMAGAAAAGSGIGWMARQLQIPRYGSRPLTGKEHDVICAKNMAPVIEKFERGERHFEGTDQKLDTIVSSMSEMKSTMSFILGTLKSKTP
jgi:hypothetical protein